MADRPLPGGAGIVPVARSEWGAAQPRCPGTELQVPVPHVVVHWSNMAPCYNSEDCVAAVRRIQKAHMDGGAADIKYNFVIGGDGKVYEGRGWRQQGSSIPSKATANPQEYKHRTILVGLIEKQYQFSHKPLIETLGKLLAQGVVSLYLQKDVEVHALVNGTLLPVPMTDKPKK